MNSNNIISVESTLFRGLLWSEDSPYSELQQSSTTDAHLVKVKILVVTFICKYEAHNQLFNYVIILVTFFYLVHSIVGHHLKEYFFVYVSFFLFTSQIIRRLMIYSVNEA